MLAPSRRSSQADEITCSNAVFVIISYRSDQGCYLLFFIQKGGLWWFSLAVLAMICRVFCILLPFWGTFEFLEQENDGWHPRLTSSCLSICVILWFMGVWRISHVIWETQTLKCANFYLPLGGKHLLQLYGQKDKAVIGLNVCANAFPLIPSHNLFTLESAI